MMTLPCPKCGASMVKNGRRAYSNSQIAQRWTCKSCRQSKLQKITPVIISSGSVTSSNSMNIRSTYRTGNKKASCTVSIPAELARKVGIYEPSQVVIEDAGNGTLIIKRLELN